MGLIPKDELDRIRREVSLVELVRQHGVVLKGEGDNLMGLCPFHNDTSPSLVVSPSKNLWNCLGSCGEGGDVIKWVQKAEAVSFRYAVEMLRKRDVAMFGDNRDRKISPTGKPARVRSTIPKLPSPVDPIADDQTTLNQVAAFYHQTLKENEAPKDYLKKRGIVHPEAIEVFKLGFANRSLGYRLPESSRKGGASIREQLMRIGVYRESGHEHFSGSLVIPITDEAGNATEMYGRRITHTSRGMPGHLYLPGPHKGVWNRQAFGSSNELILCEALIDALTFWCAGYRNVTAAYGLNGFTSEMLDVIKQSGIEKICIAYDRDDAAEAAAAKLLPTLIENGLDVFRVEFPHGHDANSFACSVDDTVDALGSLIRGANWLGKGKRADNAPSSVNAPAGGQMPAGPAGMCSTLSAGSVEPKQHVTAEEIRVLDFTFDTRKWQVRGLDKNNSLTQITVIVSIEYGEYAHVDKLDFYSDRSRGQFIKRANQETHIEERTLKVDMGNIMRQLEDLLEAMLSDILNPRPQEVMLTEDERAEALTFLRSPDLVERIAKDFETVGVVGEKTNALVSYLAAVSRKLNDPLAIIIQSSSAAGKTTLQDAVLSMMPKEDCEKYSAVTGQALFYISETQLKHKILAIVEEEGAERASYALKLLQSEGKLSIIATGKDAKTGDMKSKTYEVEGPVVLMITTTDIEIDPELQNRCLVLTVNEEREQTQLIHELQRESQTLAGILGKRDREDIRRRHQNAQRMLRPITVANELAPRLEFQSSKVRFRRDHMKYLTLIRTITLLHQYQRPVKQIEHNGEHQTYIEVEPSDIALANELAHEILGRSLDELPPQTRRLLQQIHSMVKEKSKSNGRERHRPYLFSRRAVREYTGWTDSTLKRHIMRLVDLEYLISYRSGQSQAFVYELVYDGEGDNGRSFVVGLIDPESLKCDYDGDRSALKGGRFGSNGSRTAPGSPADRPQFGGGSPEKIGASSTVAVTSRPRLRNSAKTHILGKS